MSSANATSDSNPTRAQLRLIVLGQWVQAGLALVRGATAGRGLFAGAVALWQVFQAIRLATQLAQRLSELQGVLTAAASAQAPAPNLDDPPSNAAFLRHALIEIAETIQSALGRVPGPPRRSVEARATRAQATPKSPRRQSRLTPPRGRPPDPPPRPERRRARLRSPGARLNAPPPIAAPAIGRFRLAAA
jgi:hypothetical protein